MHIDNYALLTILSCFLGLLGTFSGLFGLLYCMVKTNTMKAEVEAVSDKKLREGLEDLRVVAQNDSIELFNHFMNKGPESKDPLRDFSFRNL